MANAHPTIVLRKISPKDLYDKYLDGGFDQIEAIPNTAAALENITFTTNKYQLGMFDGETASLRDKTNSLCRIGFSNMGNKDEEGPCDYCRRPLKRCSKGLHSVGIPVHLIQTKNLSTYYLDGFYGTWECAYADLVQQLAMGRSRYNALYINSEVYMKSIYDKMYPDMELYPAQSYRFLKYNRGWMDDAEYEEHSSPFVEIPYIVFQHNKVMNIS